MKSASCIISSSCALPSCCLSSLCRSFTLLCCVLFAASSDRVGSVTCRVQSECSLLSSPRAVCGGGVLLMMLLLPTRRCECVSIADAMNNAAADEEGTPFSHRSSVYSFFSSFSRSLIPLSLCLHRSTRQLHITQHQYATSHQSYSFHIIE